MGLIRDLKGWKTSRNNNDVYYIKGPYSVRVTTVTGGKVIQVYKDDVLMPGLTPFTEYESGMIKKPRTIPEMMNFITEGPEYIDRFPRIYSLETHFAAKFNQITREIDGKVRKLEYSFKHGTKRERTAKQKELERQKKMKELKEEQERIQWDKDMEDARNIWGR